MFARRMSVNIEAWNTFSLKSLISRSGYAPVRDEPVVGNAMRAPGSVYERPDTLGERWGTLGERLGTLGERLGACTSLQERWASIGVR